MLFLNIFALHLYIYSDMKNKTQRLLAIKEIIGSKKISSQEDLLHELEELGFSYTQATLSRDLRFLKVSKVVDSEGGYMYILPENQLNDQSPGSVPVSGFKTIDFSNNLAVIKTLPGFAPSIASRIDNANPYEILGTIAGDDTILMIPREEISKNDVINALVLLMPEIKDKL
jgi:transcriptional regulator of arginine metabolism